MAKSWIEKLNSDNPKHELSNNVQMCGLTGATQDNANSEPKKLMLLYNQYNLENNYDNLSQGLKMQVLI